MKILVVGATGYIGSRIISLARNKLSVIGTSSTFQNGLEWLDLNCTSMFNYEVIQQSDIVILTAAISSPDICARLNASAYALNVTGISEFVYKVISLGARVMFFSSDAVYGERDNTFDESAQSNPAGEYAEMKAEVEKRFLGNPLFKSIRLSYVFSREDKFTKYLSGCAENVDEAELFHPFYRAIVHRDDVVEGVLALVQRWDDFPQEVINFGGPEVLSRIDYAECLQRNALPSLRFRVTEPGDEFFKNRPRVIAMSSTILPKLLGRPTRTMAEAARVEFVES